MTYRRTARASLLAVLLLPGWAVAAGLNDTGVTECADDSSNDVPCGNPTFPRQDAETGRDAQAGLSKAGGGSAGFDFTKLDNNGNPLDASATSWDCVRDNVTGLIWEIKTDDNGLRDQAWAYTWYNPNPATNGGDAGSIGGPTCGGFLSDQCNTQAYVEAVNALNPKLCGFSDWRMPTREELHSIVDYSRFDPAIDTTATGYFPRTVAGFYWSASPSAPYASVAWFVTFYTGYNGTAYKSTSDAVRLVRGGQ